MSAAVSSQPPSFHVIQEEDVVATWKISLVIAAGIGATLIAIALSAWWLAVIRSDLPWHEISRSAPAPREIARIHQAPIERDPYERERRAQQRRSLEGYRWLDRERKAAQIPIERAMQIVVEQLAGSPEPPVKATP